MGSPIRMELLYPENQAAKMQKADSVRCCRNKSPAKSKKAVVLYPKVLNNRLLC